jgi:ATP-binding cassette subfamily B protein
VETTGLTSVLSAISAVISLFTAAGILAQGPGGMTHVAVLAVWTIIVTATTYALAKRTSDWTNLRLSMTNHLVERMVGHRTRLAQERPDQRDARDDPPLQAYLGASARMDAAAVPLQVGLAAGWLLLALAALAPALLGTATGAPSTSLLAISLGGMLLAQRAFAGLAGGLGSLVRARVAWQQVRTLFLAGGAPAQDGRQDAPGRVPPDRGIDAPPASFVPRLGLRQADAAPSAPLLDATGLQFRHHPAGPPLLDGIDLRIDHGDRLLLEGGSGAGKSTLAALLTGLRRPDAGLLLLGGWDRPTLGRDWHRLATAAPQFHENHVLSATLAFNLLMGRDWPPSLADLAEAESLCHDLGLGDLLARMPAGLQQRVGETGWQLSHGERSRIFLARALLQRAPLVVLDESFAALDPATLAQCLRCTMDRADALLVIAHP